MALSRLADIENRDVTPGIYRIFTLCAIYRLDYETVLEWYGVPREELEGESLRIRLPETHLAHFSQSSAPFNCLNGLDMRRYRYGFIGLEDWSMYPVLQPGALVAIDERNVKIATRGWTSEMDRPIYFLELRDGYACGWCSLVDGCVCLQPHPASQCQPRLFELNAGVDIIGQVVAVAMPLDAKLGRISPKLHGN